MATRGSDLGQKCLRELGHGLLTPFLGAGVNLVGRGADDDPLGSQRRLPSGAELARQLAREFDYPADNGDLVHVSQWIELEYGGLALYEFLHTIFDYDYEPTIVHRLLAETPAYVRRVLQQMPPEAVRASGPRFPLIITTNYDDALERAFVDAGEPFDLLTYIAKGQNQGWFLHTAPTGQSEVITKANTYGEAALEKRAVIAKVHGAVKRGSLLPDEDSYVLTEDDYIDCLTRTEIVQLLPAAVVARMRRCHYLFLGYSLRDWNLRAILHRIRRDRSLLNRSWSVQPDPDPLEEKAWRNRNVDIYDLSLEDFATDLRHRLVAAQLVTAEGVAP